VKYAEAFKSLGYGLSSPRQQWTAQSDAGVCITLRRLLLQRREGGLWYNSELHGGDYSDWGIKPGNKLRAEHLHHALTNYAGWVDVVLVEGKSSEEYGNAEPWRISERRGYRWRVVELTDETGHFCAETQLFPS
jgi:hypothetical protein